MNICKRIVYTLLFWTIPLAGIYFVLDYTREDTALSILGAVTAAVIVLMMTLPTMKIWGINQNKKVEK